MLTGDCLEYGKLIIPTNLRCTEIQSYPDFWNLVSELGSDTTKFITEHKLKTHVLWISYGYLSSVDNVGCEQDYLLKHENVPLYTLTTEDDGKTLIAKGQTDLCWKEFKETGEQSLDKGLVIAVVSICSLILLMGMASVVLCILKIKYRYYLLKMDFLFKRQKQDLAAANYYIVNNQVKKLVFYPFTLNGIYSRDKWELSMSALDM